MKDWWDWTPRKHPWGLEKKPTEYWEDKYWQSVKFLCNLQSQYARFKGLEELNQKQAGMLMERDLTIRQLNEEIEMQKNTAEVLPFRLGNSSEPPIDNNWLSKMSNGTRFLASDNDNPKDSVLDDFVVASDPQQIKAVFLGRNLSHREGCFRWVDPVKFCREYTFYLTLEIIENKDGNTNQVQAGRVAGDADAEVVDGIHETK